MPNTPVWGQQDAFPSQEVDQDLISAAESGSVIKVNDVNDDNDNKKAAHFINSSTHADARALLVEGKAEIVRNADDETGLKVSNSSTDAEARALKVRLCYINYVVQLTPPWIFYELY